jgi:hypothetical protein
VGVPVVAAVAGVAAVVIVVVVLLVVVVMVVIVVMALVSLMREEERLETPAYFRQSMAVDRHSHVARLSRIRPPAHWFGSSVHTNRTGAKPDFNVLTNQDT